MPSPCMTSSRKLRTTKHNFTIVFGKSIPYYCNIFLCMSLHILRCHKGTGRHTTRSFIHYTESEFFSWMRPFFFSLFFVGTTFFSYDAMFSFFFSREDIFFRICFNRVRFVLRCIQTLYTEQDGFF